MIMYRIWLAPVEVYALSHLVSLRTKHHLHLLLVDLNASLCCDFEITRAEGR
jgi:hypothetical protein